MGLATQRQERQPCSLQPALPPPCGAGLVWGRGPATPHLPALPLSTRVVLGRSQPRTPLSSHL